MCLAKSEQAREAIRFRGAAFEFLILQTHLIELALQVQILLARMVQGHVSAPAALDDPNAPRAHALDGRN